jgi:hypothetical protein
MRDVTHERTTDDVARTHRGKPRASQRLDPSCSAGERRRAGGRVRGDDEAVRRIEVLVLLERGEERRGEAAHFVTGCPL